MVNINPHYNDCYFSEEGGLEESVWVFVKGNKLSRFISSDDIYVGETGFGSGLNLIALIDWINNEIKGYSGTVNYFSCEKYPLKPSDAEDLLIPLFIKNRDKLSEYLEFYSKFYSGLKPGINSTSLKLYSVKIKVTLFYGDVKDALHLIGNKRDVWFLDGHDPEKNPDMWNSDVFSLIADKSHSGTTLSTYTARGSVKRGLRNSGFFIKRKKGYGRKRHMIEGEFL